VKDPKTGREWNLSYASLTSFDARETLRNMKTTDPKFWEDLTKAQRQNLPDTAETLPEDDAPDTNLEDEVGDDSELPMPLLISAMTSGNLPEGVAIDEDGGLVSVAEAESVDIEQEPDGVVGESSAEANYHDQPKDIPKEEGPERRGKRIRTTSKRYDTSLFWRHNDGDDWKDDSLLRTGLSMSHQL